MTETVVHVTTIEEWKGVLDVWFENGYDWPCTNKGKSYREILFHDGSRQLGINVRGGDEISFWVLNTYNGDNLIEYSEFMEEQQKEDNKMETYYVTQEQLDLIQELKSQKYPLYKLLNSIGRYQIINFRLNSQVEKSLLRYLGGDETIEFKVKEQLYRLWRSDNYGDIVYMTFADTGTPMWTPFEDDAFTVPLEEIMKHKTISWDIEEVK